MFEVLFVIGIVLAFYGYSAMKNPNVWGDQGRDEIKPENWNGYVVHNGQFMMYAGFFLAALAALDVIFDFAGWLYILILLGEANANKNACAGFKPAQAFLLS